MQAKYFTIPPLKTINFKNEILAGLTVAMTMIPESLSFAIVAGLTPLIGLYGAFLMGIVTAILGGRPGLVSGAAGATVLVMMSLVASHGVEYFFAAVLLAGVLQILVGVFKLGKFVRLIPQPVMYGFLNGLAVSIFWAQVSQFKISQTLGAPWMQGTALYTMLGLTLLTIGIVYFFPKITKAVPSSLVAIIIVSVLVYFIGIDTKQVVDIAKVSGSLPSFSIPMVPFTIETLQIVVPYALIMASVGLVESLLTLNMVDDITSSKGSANQESIAQGAANITNGFFGGMGGCAMVAQTLVNINAGARTKLAALIGALTILVVILVGGPVIEQIPMAALVGVMMVVAITTFQWSFFRMIKKMPKSDIFVGILVALITIILRDLAIAVLIGVIVSALVFAWDNAKRIRARKSVNEKGEMVYEICGPLFFGSTTAFIEKFQPASDPHHIIIDFTDSRIADMSAIEALKKVIEKYQAENKKVTIRRISQDSYDLLANAKGYIEVDIEHDPTYKVMP